MSRPLVCAVITNVPVPYRLAMWERLAALGGVTLHLVYCAPAHVDPTQDGRQTPGYTSHFLDAPYEAKVDGFAHADWGVTRLLDRIQPDVVVTTGFIWTYLFAFAWTRLRGVPHVAMTDGTDTSEAGLSRAHRVVRRLVFAGTRSFVGASEGAWRLYAQYGVPRQRFFKASLCIDNARFAAAPGGDRPFDLLFSGRMVPHKNPMFVLDVAAEVARRLGRRVTLRVLGQGDLVQAFQAKAQGLADLIDMTFSGYLPQRDLPAAYQSAKVFLFPSLFEPWGVVANEACAAGAVCVVSPQVGAAGELVIDAKTGVVATLDVGVWAERVAALLSQPDRWSVLSQAAQAHVQGFSFEASAPAMKAALVQACARGDA